MLTAQKVEEAKKAKVSFVLRDTKELIFVFCLSEEAEDRQVKNKGGSIGDENELVPELQLSHVKSAESKRSKESKSKFGFKRYERNSHCCSVY